MNHHRDLATLSPPPQVKPRQPRVLLFLVAACILAALLHSTRLLAPTLAYDDFALLAESWTWPQTRANLWQPANEHAMPLGRLSTWLLVRAAGRITALPFLTGWQGLGSLLLALLLVYFFVRRELASPFVGLLALTLFGVTAVYQQAVTWFAASFQVLALDTFLLALLAAQDWRLRGRWPYLLLCVFAVTLAPMWFASGILAGPLCTLYLLPRDQEPRPSWPRRALALVPLLGTLLFLAISLPLTGARIVARMREDRRLEHLWATGTESMPFLAVTYTCRALVDYLALGLLGIGTITLPAYVAAALLVPLLLAAGWWWWRAPRHRLLLLGLGTILLSYLLTYAGRSHAGYEFMSTWSRYHLFPQLGLVLYVCGGLHCQEAAEPGRLSPRQGRLLRWLLPVLFFSQLPHGILGSLHYDPTRPFVLDELDALAEQRAIFNKIDRMDARCRLHHIDADTARAALPPWLVEQRGTYSAWDFLRGSDDPRPISVSQARALLEQ